MSSFEVRPAGAFADEPPFAIHCKFGTLISADRFDLGRSA